MNLDKLYSIVTGNQPQGNIHEGLLKQTSKANLGKAQREIPVHRGLNKDPYMAFTNWFDSSQKYVDNYNREDYWSSVLQVFPGSEAQAKDFLRAHIATKSKGDPYEEEGALRNLATKVPSWALTEMQPKLGFLQSVNSNQNLMKAISLYKTNLDSRMKKMMSSPLDSDVPEEEHLKDFLKLESSNLLDVAQVANGRLVVANNNGKILPAFQMENRNQVIKDDPNGTPPESEMALIYKAAPEIMQRHIKENLTKGKDVLAMSNRASSSVAIKMLENNQLDIPNWGEAFAITNNMEPDFVMNKAIDGYVSKNPYMSEKDMFQKAIEISNAYPDMISEINLRKNNVSIPTKPTN